MTLTADKWQKTHRSGLFYGASEQPLMLRADYRVARIDDLALARDEAPKKLDLLIVDLLGILGTKKALFG